jgi:hypothetical protein
VVVDTGLPDFCGAELAWHAEDTAAHPGEVALAATTGTCGFVVGNLRFYGDAAL